MEDVSSALIQVINTQNTYYEYIESNGVNPDDPEYIAAVDARAQALAAFEAGLAAFTPPA